MLHINWLDTSYCYNRQCDNLKIKGNLIQKKTALATSNFKALNVIFVSVDTNQFKLISSYECARDAWNIPQTAHERTLIVNISKLQMLATKFEDLRMMENEIISDFNSKLCI